jgi:hypothetical protein
MPLKQLLKKQSLDLPVQGGKPHAEVKINDSELRTNRTGFSAVKKVVGGVKK